MPKNYYVILGIGRDSTLEEVKAAFRQRAMELHPDRTGRDSEPFLEVQEAYGVLRDPARRSSYDRQFSASSPKTYYKQTAEPFIPPRRGEPFGEVFFTSFGSYMPSYEELFARWWSNFDRGTRPKAERLGSLTLEVVLSPEDAAAGGWVRVMIPSRATCSYCRGAGAVGRYECSECDGQGTITGEYPLDVGYPPGLRDGHVQRMALNRFGIENYYLTVLFRVSF